MITVADAHERLLQLVGPGQIEHVALRAAHGRVLALAQTAARAQPPFDASSMDGYAISRTDVAPGDSFAVIGTSAAGHVYDGALAEGQAIRIFTGAPVPKGGCRVLIQEDVARQGDVITACDSLETKHFIRPAGDDFAIGDQIKAPRVLAPQDVALLASMNCPVVPVFARPKLALIATGDELALPGESPRADQIIASNTFGLAALFESAGAEVQVLPVARDTVASLSQAFELAQGSDLVITIGGASVGDHDIVAIAAEGLGLHRDFYKVAMRPGKPLMAGHLDGAAMVGLPGNPVSSMVCGEIFILPMLRKMLGLPASMRQTKAAILSEPLGQNGPREHYMRAVIDPVTGSVAAFARQDSALLSVLSQANALIIRAPNDGAKQKGETVEVIELVRDTLC